MGSRRQRPRDGRDQVHARDRDRRRPNRSPGPGIEVLEPRTLLAAGVLQYPIPTAQSNPFWITPGPGAELYFTAVGANQIGAYNPSSHGFTSFSITGLSLSSNSYITAAPDGNLYFTSSGINSIEQFNPTTHATQAYPIPLPNLGPSYITTGSDGKLDFIATNANEIVQLDPTSHVFTGYPIPTPNAGATSITSGPGDELWFVEGTAQKIAALDPATRVVSEFSMPVANSGATYIAAGSDGDLYFTEPAANALGQFNPTTRAFTSYPIPAANTRAAAITAGPDGNIYFTEPGANAIGQFNPATRTFAQYPILTANSGVEGITTGADGNIYFTESSANQIGELPISTTTTGTQLFVSPNPSSVGQVNTLTAVVKPQGGARPTGTVTFFIDGRSQSTVALVNVGGQGQAKDRTKLPPGDHVITAVYNGNATIPASTSNAVPLVVVPAPGDGPVVTNLVRLGYHSRATTLVLSFDQALDPASAEGIGNYRIVGPGNRRVGIASVLYNPATLTVTVSPRGRLNLHRTYRLTVVGTSPNGVSNTGGLLLDGALNGYPGSNYTAKITGNDLDLPR
jgi:virginiamycin B lyase